MADAPDQGTASPQNLEQSYDSAAESLGIDQEPAAAPAPAPEPAAPEKGTAPEPEEPEHIRWAKRIQGDYDPQTGQFVTDRIVKRAYELNRQAQAQAQELAAVRQMLNRPEIAQALQQALQPPAAAKQEPAAEKSDEEILREFVHTEAQKLVQPVMAQTTTLYDRYLASEISGAHERLRSAFGKEDDGTPVFDRIAPEIGAQLQQQASVMNMPVPQLVVELVNRGLLFGTLENLGKTILYPKILERVKSQPQPAAPVAEKRKTNLPGRGSPSSSVHPAPRKIETFADAVAAAEAELAELGQRQ